MYIDSIIDRDGDNFEYEVVVSDGKYKLLCFADKKLKTKNCKIKLYALFTNNLKRISQKTMLINKTSDYFGYFFMAEVVNREQGIVRIFDFEMELDEVFPKEINNGDYIKFSCTRIDCSVDYT